MLEKITGLTFGGTASKYLCPYVAKELGVTEEVAYAQRHVDRALWYKIGNEVRETDIGALLRPCFEAGDIGAGLRDYEELDFGASEGMFTHILWVSRDVPPDPTLMFTYGQCIATASRHNLSIHFVGNFGTLNDLEHDLREIAGMEGWLQKPEPYLRHGSSISERMKSILTKTHA